jgi:hypothetical protein
MRSSFGFALVLFAATGLYAQRGSQPVLRGTTPSVVHPAGPAGSPGVTRTTPSVVNPGGGGVHLAVPNTSLNGFRRYGATRSGTGYIANYPFFVGGYYDMPYITPQMSMDYQAAPAPPQQNITIIYPPQQPAAPVMMNPYMPGDSTTNPGPAQPAAVETNTEPEHYLIALKDHTIYSAVAYWVQGDTLHYFTSGNTHNQVSLTLVDRDLTGRLNKDSGVEVKLPAAK